MSTENQGQFRVILRPAGLLLLGGVVAVGATSIVLARMRPALTQVKETTEPIPLLAAPRRTGGIYDDKTKMEIVPLSSFGKRDWVVWGAAPKVRAVRKADGTKEIGAVELIRPDDSEVGDGKKGLSRGVSWSGGEPIASTNVSYVGLHVGGQNGFRFSVPASTEPRTLRVYVGGMKTGGEFSAWVSDGTKPDVKKEDVALDAGYYSRVYTVTFKAAAPKQDLKIVWRNNGTGGNVSLQGAALE